MSVNTCEKTKKEVKTVYTLHHLVVSQTTLPVLEASSHSNLCIPIIGHSILASHHGSNAPYIIVIKLQGCMEIVNGHLK